MKVVIAILAVTAHQYADVADFMKPKKYTVAEACEYYQATDCEIRHDGADLCIDGGAEILCDRWVLYGKPKGKKK